MPGDVANKGHKTLETEELNIDVSSPAEFGANGLIQYAIYNPIKKAQIDKLKSGTMSLAGEAEALQRSIDERTFLSNILHDEDKKVAAKNKYISLSKKRDKELKKNNDALTKHFIDSKQFEEDQRNINYAWGKIDETFKEYARSNLNLTGVEWAETVGKVNPKAFTNVMDKMRGEIIETDEDKEKKDKDKLRIQLEQLDKTLENRAREMGYSELEYTEQMLKNGAYNGSPLKAFKEARLKELKAVNEQAKKIYHDPEYRDLMNKTANSIMTHDGRSYEGVDNIAKYLQAKNEFDSKRSVVDTLQSLHDKEHDGVAKQVLEMVQKVITK